MLQENKDISFGYIKMLEEHAKKLEGMFGSEEKKKRQGID